jgi:hypothetical protein
MEMQKLKNPSYSFPVKSIFCLNGGEKRESNRRFPKMFRQYTFTCEQDLIDINEGYCPQYAVCWLDEYNRAHWPEGTLIRHREEYVIALEKRRGGGDVGLNSNEEEEERGENLEKKSEEVIKTVRFDLFREIIPIYEEFSEYRIDSEDSFQEGWW